MISANKWLLAIMSATILLLPTLALAAGGTVQYPDGSPAAGAQVSVTGGGEGKTTITCDASGRFELPAIPAEHAVVRVKAEGKDYAQLRLPVSLFKSGDVAIVLPAKQGGIKP
jgi:hypothetical protein